MKIPIFPYLPAFVINILLIPAGYSQTMMATSPHTPVNPGLHLQSGRIERLESFPSKLVDARNVDIWLPDGYGTDNTRYDVIYMHDGQMLFDPAVTWNKQSWEVDSILGRLIGSRRIRPCIVVGIWNNGGYRHIEFMPQRALDYLTPEERKRILSYSTPEKGLLYRGEPRADNYLKFLVTELKPFIDRQYRTRSNRRHTFIAGSSMGGLISLYAICEYPRIFRGAACLSTHWTGTYYAAGNPVPGAMAAYLEDHLPSPASHRIYFDLGSETLDSLYAPFQDMIDRVMKNKGFGEKEWITRRFPGENHSENAWRRRFEIPVVFFLGRLDGRQSH